MPAEGAMVTVIVAAVPAQTAGLVMVAVGLDTVIVPVAVAVHPAALVAVTV